DLAAMASGHGQLTLHLSGAGSFSGRTLWIGVGGEVSRLESLMREELLGEPDRERRRAHLTVARATARPPRPPRGRTRSSAPAPAPARILLADAVRALSVYRGPAWESTELELVAPHLGQGRFGGPPHAVLGTVRLGP